MTINDWKAKAAAHRQAAQHSFSTIENEINIGLRNEALIYALDCLSEATRIELYVEMLQDKEHMMWRCIELHKHEKTIVNENQDSSQPEGEAGATRKFKLTLEPTDYGEKAIRVGNRYIPIKPMPRKLNLI